MEDRDNLEENFVVSDDTGDSAPSRMGLFGLLAGVVGIVLAIAAMVMANSANKALEELKASMDNRPDRTEELQAGIKDVDDRLVAMGSELVRLNRVDRQIREEVQSALDGISRDVRQNRQLANETAASLREVVTTLESRVASRPATTTTRTAATTSETASGADAAASGGSGGPSVAVPADGIYTIQSGDTMSAIASRFGVSLTELMNANPGVNPRALQIGQKIMIPR
jgi:LysM repeat protein